MYAHIHTHTRVHTLPPGWPAALGPVPPSSARVYKQQPLCRPVDINTDGSGGLSGRWASLAGRGGGA